MHHYKTAPDDWRRGPRKIDHAVAVARGRLAVGKRDDPHGDHTEKERDLAEAKIAAFIRKTLAGAPELRGEQRAALAGLLEPVRA